MALLKRFIFYDVMMPFFANSEMQKLTFPTLIPRVMGDVGNFVNLLFQH